jgi:hypothetical protein
MSICVVGVPLPGKKAFCGQHDIEIAVLTLNDIALANRAGDDFHRFGSFIAGAPARVHCRPRPGWSMNGVRPYFARGGKSVRRIAWRPARAHSAKVE